MKIKNKIIISFIIFFGLLVLNTKVQAASASISASSTKVTPGTKVTITTKINGASWQVSLSGAVSATYSDSTSDAEDTVKTEKITFTPKKEGTYKVTLSGNVTGSRDSSATSVSNSVTITVKKKTSNNTTDTTSKPSTDATLSNLGIKPNDFSGFRKANTSYAISVPKNVDKISIYATPSNSKATVTGTGSKSLQIGKNTFNIKVTAEDKKTTKTYTLTITRKDKEEVQSDATLTNLGIRPKEYDFTGFKPSVTTYNISVPNDVEKITIYANAKNAKDTITGLGNKNIKVGQNKCEIKVTSEDKKISKTYVLNVTRKEKEEDTEENESESEENDKEAEESNKKISDGLKNIEIKEGELTPNFSQDVYAYKVNAPSGTQKLDINTEKTSDNIEVEIAGNEDLKQGENIITILVHNKKNDTTSTYQITANIENQEIDLSVVNDEFKEARKKIKIQEWIIKGTIIAIIVLIIVYLIERYKISQEYDENEDYDEDEEDDDNDAEEEEDDEDQDTEDDDIRYKQSYNSNTQFNSTASDELRDIGLFDEQQEYDEYRQHRKNRKYKGRRFK